MLKKRILSAILCLVMICSVLITTACSNNLPENDTEEVTESETNQTEKPTEDADGEDSVVILYENDVHCSVEGYAKIAAMKKELAASFDHAGVVSSGDFVQGGTLGAISRGEYIVDIMNEIGYDA
jgi:2',3'-cyclic-nucleotide 2'-phosphodiesterase (5'-nucleotidase family)